MQPLEGRRTAPASASPQHFPKLGLSLQPQTGRKLCPRRGRDTAQLCHLGAARVGKRLGCAQILPKLRGFEAAEAADPSSWPFQAESNQPRTSPWCFRRCCSPKFPSAGAPTCSLQVKGALASDTVKGAGPNAYSSLETWGFHRAVCFQRMGTPSSPQ